MKKHALFDGFEICRGKQYGLKFNIYIQFVVREQQGIRGN
jgi:hypothetical protein